MNILYLSQSDYEKDSNDQVIAQAIAQGYCIDKQITDASSIHINWIERSLYTMIETAHEKTTLITPCATELACSTAQILEIFERMAQHKMGIYFIQYDEYLELNAHIDSVQLLKLLRRIESEFVSKRTKIALARRKSAGLPLGRPKGRKNKTRKLDAFRDDIIRYLELKLSKAAIAKLIGCHPQTLSDYMAATRLNKVIEQAKNTLASQSCMTA